MRKSPNQAGVMSHMSRLWRRAAVLPLVVAGCLLVGCSSQPLDKDASEPGGSSSGGSSSDVPPTPPRCSAALRQSLSLVDEASTADVSVLMGDDSDRTLYVDASAGGLNGQDENPWVYVSLARAEAVRITDIEALTSTAWDLAFKRFYVRTNDGDSGPGRGGALRVNLGWDQVSAATLGRQQLATETWFDQDCNLQLDDAMEVVTTFTGWSEYDEAHHVLTAANVVFITAGADGKLYKVAILDYYSTPTGARGADGAHYKLRVAPL